MDIDHQLVGTEQREGYELRTERCVDGSGHEWDMVTAYTLDGSYIGEEARAKMLIEERGIKPEKAKGDHNVCSIGFCEKEQKWYGWSHRAIYGFGIGDKVKEGDCAMQSGYIPEYIAEHPEEDISMPVGFEIKTLEDARRVAMAFAESVS